ncbi:MAG: NAD(P)-dependent oxidoreductase [Ruminococcus sp.]|nr:NAD(P)-dependent oxidoreductase [Ruminococcus sp.]
MGAHNECKEDREENDFYATQPIAAEWLIKLENLDNNIWECACGQGHLGKVFEEHGYNVLATDLIDRGYGQGGVDFLKSDGLFIGDIVTNPPYKYAQEFIEHALSLIPDGYKVCMFLKVQFLEGKARRKLYTNCPPRTVYISSSRIQCGRNGDFKGSMVAYAWYVWEKGYKGNTILKWFN